jgi:hypothetical protein
VPSFVADAFPRRSTSSLEVNLRLRNPEALFIAIPIVVVGAILFSLVNEAVDTGVRIKGQILNCSSWSRRAGPRECIVDVRNQRPIHALSPYAHPGDMVTVSKMVTRLSGSTFYEIVTTTSN